MQQGNMPGATIGPDQAIYDMAHFAKVLDLNIIGTILPSQVFSKILRDKNRESSSIFHQLQLKGLCLE
jgi:hypothetical protein